MSKDDAPFSDAEGPQGPYGQPPYGQGPYGQPPYGQQPHGQAPYGQPQHGRAPYGQSPYASTGQGGYSQAPPPQGSFGGGGYPPPQSPYSPYGQSPSSPYGQSQYVPHRGAMYPSMPSTYGRKRRGSGGAIRLTVFLVILASLLGVLYAGYNGSGPASRLMLRFHPLHMPHEINGFTRVDSADGKAVASVMTAGIKAGTGSSKAKTAVYADDENAVNPDVVLLMAGRDPSRMRGWSANGDAYTEIHGKSTCATGNGVSMCVRTSGKLFVLAMSDDNHDFEELASFVNYSWSKQ